MSFEPKKHVAAWRPYDGENSKDAKHKAIKEVTWGSLLTEDLVGTVNANGKFIAWKLPGCEAAYIIENFGRPVAVSPKGKYLVAAKNSKLYVFETATGACKGELESPSVNVNSIRAAFHPRGKHLAALVKGRLDRACVMWDLTTGKIERQFPVPSIVANFHDSSYRYWGGQNGAIAWRGDQHLVTDFGYLINVESQCLVWHYIMGNRNNSLNSPDGRHWQLARKDFRGPYLLQPIDMPSDRVKRGEAFIKLQDQLVLYPGSSVRLDVRLTVGAQKVSSSQVATAMAAKLKERGIEVSDAAPITLSVTSKQGTTGTTIEVSKSRFPSFGFNFGRRRPTPGAKTFQQQKMVCVMQLTDSSNKVVWKREATVAMRSYGSVKKESAQSDLTKEMQSSFAQMVSSGSVLDRYMSTFVFKDPEVLIGERRSVITDKGETEYVKPDPNKRQPNRTGTRSPFNRSPRRPSFRPPRFRSPFR